MTAIAKQIRHAARIELEALITAGLITTLQEGRLPSIDESQLPLLRIKRGDEVIDPDTLGGMTHGLELLLEYFDRANEDVDDRIDDVVEQVLTLIMHSSSLDALTTHITPLAIELDDGNADTPMAAAVVRVQFNYERGL